VTAKKVIAVVLTILLTLGVSESAAGSTATPKEVKSVVIIRPLTQIFTTIGRTIEIRRSAARYAARQKQIVEFMTILAEKEEKKFTWPVSGTFTSEFGWRWGAMHQGIDIAAPMGTPVMASQSGMIVSSGYDGGYGNKVVIKHAENVHSVYAHNQANIVSAGQWVAKGEIVAYLGSTGDSTGPHLHFEIHVDGVAQNPRYHIT
jgi:murein DD-endopeptidase MepM/ murein hydrolase activator NlpD